MRVNPFSGWVLVLFPVLALVSEREAAAYIPPSNYIVKTMALKRSGIKGLKIRSTIVALKDGKPSGVRLKETAFFESVTRVLRSRIMDESGRELYVGERKFYSGDSAEAPFGERLNELLLVSQADALSKTLISSGVRIVSEAELQALLPGQERIEVEQTSMQRLNGAVAWVLGGSSTKKSGLLPQLWVEKDTFLPLRWIAQSHDGMAEATFQNYRFFREFPYPRLIEVSRAGVLQFRVELAEVQVSSELSELKKTATPGFTDAGNSADSGVRDLIRKYFELAR